MMTLFGLLIFGAIMFFVGMLFASREKSESIFIRYCKNCKGIDPDEWHRFCQSCGAELLLLEKPRCKCGEYYDSPFVSHCAKCGAPLMNFKDYTEKKAEE